jgi:adenine deaminase
MRMLCVATISLLACSGAPSQKSKPEHGGKTYEEQLPSAVVSRIWQQPRPIVIRHALVMPATSPSIPDGAVSFANGKIVAVGPDAQVQSPPGAEEIDARGLVVTPGIIDAHSHLGVYATPQTRRRATATRRPIPSRRK